MPIDTDDTSMPYPHESCVRTAFLLLKRKESCVVSTENKESGVCKMYRFKIGKVGTLVSAIVPAFCQYAARSLNPRVCFSEKGKERMDRKINCYFFPTLLLFFLSPIIIIVDFTVFS